jgi:hypothetical protein
VCGSAARTDLYGGQLAIAVPTVTGAFPRSYVIAGKRWVCHQVAFFDSYTYCWRRITKVAETTPC